MRTEDKWKRSLKFSDLKARKGKLAKPTKKHRVETHYNRKGKHKWEGDNEDNQV